MSHITASSWLKSFISRDEGVTAIEYATLSSLIGAVIVAVLIGVGAQLGPTFTTISGALQISNANAAGTPRIERAHDDDEGGHEDAERDDDGDYEDGERHHDDDDDDDDDDDRHHDDGDHDHKHGGHDD